MPRGLWQGEGAGFAVLCGRGDASGYGRTELHLFKETGTKVRLDYADSGELLIRIVMTRRGDLYVCHDPFLAGLEREGFAREGWTVAVVTPTIVVQKGNPKGITGIQDLAKPGIRLGLTDETYSTLGHICPLIFDRAKLRREIEANVVTRTRMGGEVANPVVLKHLDAAIVWNAVAFLRHDRLTIIPISPELLQKPGVDAVTSASFGVVDMGRIRVTIATLKCSRQPELATRFAEFVVSRRGRALFAKYGFSPAPERVEGQTLHLYCGAGVRPAVSEAVETFTKLTGVRIEVDYAGSGGSPLKAQTCKDRRPLPAR